MPGTVLTMAATLMCPHGGTVVPIPSGSRVNLAGSPILLATDTFVVAGCPFTPVAYHPCVSVQWQLTAQQSSGQSAATLTVDSLGLCQAADGAIQGPVVIQAAPAQVTGA